MAHNIKISPEIYAKLEALAVGFDSPESVIARLISEKNGDAKPVESINTQVKNTKERKRITIEVIEKLYPLVKDVYEGRKKSDNVAKFLEAENIMDKGSVVIYIKAFSAMKRGENFKRAINDTGARYFLEKILADDGMNGLRLALNSVMANIEYFEAAAEKNNRSKTKIRRNGTRKIHAEFSAKLT